MDYQRSKKRKNPVMRVLLWIIGILLILVLLAIAYLTFKIFSTGGAIHNPLNREHSALRSSQVNMDKGGTDFYCTFWDRFECTTPATT